MLIWFGIFCHGLAAAQQPGPLPPIFEQPKEPIKQSPPGQKEPIPGPKLLDGNGKQPWISPSPVPFGPRKFILPSMTPLCAPYAPTAGVLGEPVPTAETVNKLNRFVKELIDPEMALDLVSGRTRLMVFKQIPKRIQIADEGTAGYTLLSPTELSLLGAASASRC